MTTTLEIAFKIGRLVILLDSSLHLQMMSRLGSIMVLCDVRCQGTSSTTDAIRDYHQSGNNPSIRVGDEPSASTAAGINHSTTVAEQSAPNHGAGTAYCGRVIYSNYSSSYHYISVGIGQVELRARTTPVDTECQSYSSAHEQHAYCNDTSASASCPRGWGNRVAYENFRSGCHDGTYYPNPAPATNTNIFTGSQTTGCHMLDALTLCESYFGGYFPDRVYPGVFYTRIIPYSGGSFDGSLLRAIITPITIRVFTR